MILLASMTLTAQIYMYVAIGASVILVIQFIMALIGVNDDFELEGGDGDGVDTDFDADGGLRLITIRGLVSFLAAAGWSGFVLELAGSHIAVVTTVSLLVGVVALVGIAFLFKFILKLQFDGTMDPKNAIGKTAEVYLPIVPGGKNVGKIMVEVQGKLAEFEAVTESNKSFSVGERVRVTGMQGETIYIVEEYIPG